MSDVSKEVKEEGVKINKWDGNTTKYALDDSVRKIVTKTYSWKEKHTLMDIRLLISVAAVSVAAAGLIYDYKFAYPASSTVCAICCVTYFILISILQFYMWYVEKDVFFQAVEKTPAGNRTWCFSGEMQRYDDKYTLTISYHRGSSSGSAKVTKSIATYITEEGEILNGALKNEVEILYNRLTRKE